jgi:MFS transporter, DHA3 family, macrolide efflux protein
MSDLATAPDRTGDPRRWRPRAVRDPWHAFLLIWAGQSISVLGSRLNGFALSIWVFQSTGSVALFGSAVLLLTLPGMLIAPWAGALVDRFSRRWVMILSNTGAALVTFAAVFLLARHHLEIWHLCLILAANSVFDSFQQPAYLAASTLLVPKQRFGRASGMMQLSLAGGRILAPVLAGFMVPSFGLAAVLLVDGATFVVAVVSLLGVRLTEPPPSPVPVRRPALRVEVAEGWRYLRERPGLLGLVGLFAGGGLFLSMLEVLMLPLILTLGSVTAAGAVSSAMGFGMLLGSLAMSAWGGPQSQVRGLLAFSLVQGLALVLAGLRADLTQVTIAFFLFAMSLPLANGCNQVLWQSKIPPALQGRIFALRRLSVQMVAPVGMLLAGPLADRVFEPLLAPGGALAASAGRLLGTGAGRGIGLFLVLLGIAITLLVLGAAASPRLRRIEVELPDAVAT